MCIAIYRSLTHYCGKGYHFDPHPYLHGDQWKHICQQDCLNLALCTLQAYSMTAILELFFCQFRVKYIVMHNYARIRGSSLGYSSISIVSGSVTTDVRISTVVTWSSSTHFLLCVTHLYNIFVLRWVWYKWVKTKVSPKHFHENWSFADTLIVRLTQLALSSWNLWDNCMKKKETTTLSQQRVI